MNDVANRQNNPFGSAQIAATPSGNAVAQSDQQRAIAEVQAAMVIARMNPRDPHRGYGSHPKCMHAPNTGRFSRLHL